MRTKLPEIVLCSCDYLLGAVFMAIACELEIARVRGHEYVVNVANHNVSNVVRSEGRCVLESDTRCINSIYRMNNENSITISAAF